MKMKKTIRLVIALAVIMVASSSCKTKQKMAEISGANIEAMNETPEPSTSAVVVRQPSVNDAEVTRNENFGLAEGETNMDALNFKYHVVVGSFKSQDNARGLQSTLNGEGNKAVVVVNEQAMFRVLIASFNEYPQARARINQINARFPDAWVLVKK